MQYMVLFSHLTVQLPAKAMSEEIDSERRTSDRQCCCPSSRSSLCVDPRHSSKHYSVTSCLTRHRVSHLHDDAGHDVLERLLELGQAREAGLHYAVGPLVHLRVLKEAKVRDLVKPFSLLNSSLLIVMSCLY